MKYLAFFFFLAVSCQKIDHNYRDIIKNGEINYTGRVDSVKASSGISRIAFTYLLVSDPKITKVVIYWNDMKDSVVQPVVRTSNVDTVTTLINDIPEGSYTFTVITYDNNGNSSIAVTAQGNVYGPKYESFLNHRVVFTTEYTNSADALISWYNADPQMVGTELVYTDINDVERVVFAPVSERESLMVDYKPGTTYKFRTLHQPESGMLDTLRSSYITASPDQMEVTSTYFSNPGNPFLSSSWDGERYGVLADWTVTANVNNKGGYGSYDNIDNSASMSLGRTDVLEPALSNGRISKTMTLDEGTYSFIVYFNDTVFNGTVWEPGFSLTGATATRVVVASGAALPAAAPTATNSLAFATINEKSIATFTLETTKQVTMGIRASYAAGVEGYVRASKVKLLKQL